MATSLSVPTALRTPGVALSRGRSTRPVTRPVTVAFPGGCRSTRLPQQPHAHPALECDLKAHGTPLVCRAALAGAETANAPSQPQPQPQPQSQAQSQPRIPPQSSGSGSDQMRLEQEWARGPHPAIAREALSGDATETDREWLHLSLPLPGAPGANPCLELETLDEVWLCLGLADPLVLTSAAVALNGTVADAAALSDTVAGAVAVPGTMPEVPRPAPETGSTAPSPAAPGDSYFAMDVRPVVLFDGESMPLSPLELFKAP